MNRARAWVLTVALSCFGAGLAVGLVAPGAVEAVSSRETWSADEDFLYALVEELDLKPKQVEQLRLILAAREQEIIQHIREFSSLGILPSGLQDLLDAAGGRADGRIQFILDENQKERFQKLMDREGDRWPRP